eukprot:gene18571-biopygen18369
MVLDQGLLGLPDRALDRLQLLGDLEAGTPGLDHLDDLAQMPIRALQPFDDGGMGFVDMGCGHDFSYPPGLKAGFSLVIAFAMTLGLLL